MVNRGYNEIWDKGLATGGGYGFWGHEILRGPKARVALKAWVDGLRSEGYNNRDIVSYGDSRDGRHIADEMYGHGYAGMKKIVKKNAMKVMEWRRVLRTEGNEERYA